jgi:hypothetical protein
LYVPCGTAGIRRSTGQVALLQLAARAPNTTAFASDTPSAVAFAVPT